VQLGASLLLDLFAFLLEEFAFKLHLLALLFLSLLVEEIVALRGLDLHSGVGLLQQGLLGLGDNAVQECSHCVAEVVLLEHVFVQAVVHLAPHYDGGGLRKEALVPQLLEALVLEFLQLGLGNDAADLLLVRQFLLFLHDRQLLLAPADFVFTPALFFLQTLSLQQFGITQSFELELVLLHGLKFLLLKHFHATLLQRLAHDHLQDRLNLSVEVEQVPVPDLCLHIESILARDEAGSRGSVDLEVCLDVNSSIRGFVLKFEGLEDGVISTDAVHTDVLAAVHWLRSTLALDLLELLILLLCALLGLHDSRVLLHVGDDHGRLGVAPDYAPVEHDVGGLLFGFFLKGVSLLLF